MLIKSVSLALLVVASSSSVVMACDDACISRGATGGRCWYTCADRCSRTGSYHRDEFLGGLQSRGYSCQPEGWNTLSCATTDGFGACTSHKWTCGAGC
ncbi:uncharacterized protein BX664DRAFT_372543 [Halteromyces radiatus]|uniref:uncharacterized protein n=1 Tax=Halteromyces radiatus TaxID=101107 RepID=UPI00222034E1|nr:uncharacterized protein BX664DRAFT_372543 [Halteromyces radiatus]KAI8093698.1 hypothetical protein BX664DRAFT_372543 [Halteromyces radiatus]